MTLRTISGWSIATGSTDSALFLAACYIEKHYFDGDLLPSEIHIGWAREIIPPGGAREGKQPSGVYIPPGQAADGLARIFVNERLKDCPAAYYWALCHELIHLKHPGHGQEFIDEALRLLKADPEILTGSQVLSVVRAVVT